AHRGEGWRLHLRGRDARGDASRHGVGVARDGEGHRARCCRSGADGERDTRRLPVAVGQPWRARAGAPGRLGVAGQRASRARNLDRRPASGHRAIGEAPMSLIVTSPLRGWASAIDSVPDPVFAERMMGDGVAIQPLDDTVVAPFDGEVTTLHDSAHAVALRSAEGVELLIHIGLDTVALKGKGFTPLVAPGQWVARGDPLIRFDIDAVALAAASLITPVIVTN